MATGKLSDAEYRVAELARATAKLTDARNTLRPAFPQLSDEIDLLVERVRAELKVAARATRQVHGRIE